MQAEYRFLAEQSRQGVWRLDSHGRIVEVNAQMAKWLDTQPALLIGRRATEFLVTMDARRVPRLMRSGKFDAEFRTATRIDRLAEVHSLLLRDENGAVIGALQLIHDRTASAAIEARLVREVQRMARLAGEDFVTELPNRRSFELTLQDALKESDEFPFALAVVDLDGFKEINDTFGHAVGDAALAEFSNRLKELVRETDYVARLGGDEFAVILRDLDEASVSDAIKRLSSGLSFVADIDGRQVPLRASIGVAHSLRHREELVLRADRAMYANKRRRQKSGNAANGNQDRSTA